HAENLARDEHGYLSLVEIQRQSGLGPGVGLFDSLLTFENYPMDLGGEGGGQTGLRASGMGVDGGSSHALDLAAACQGELTVDLQYPRAQFSEATIRRLLGHLGQVLEGMAAG